MSIFTAIEQAKRRDDVVEPYAFEIREQAIGRGIYSGEEWHEINQAIIDKWSLAGLKYIKERAWRSIEAASGSR